MRSINEGDFVRINRGSWIGKTGYVSEVRIDEDGSTQVCVEIILSPNESEDVCVPSTMVEKARH